MTRAHQLTMSYKRIVEQTVCGHTSKGDSRRCDSSHNTMYSDHRSRLGPERAHSSKQELKFKKSIELLSPAVAKREEVRGLPCLVVVLRRRVKDMEMIKWRSRSRQFLFLVTRRIHNRAVRLETNWAQGLKVP
jgi:hypothetical protein